MVIQRYTRVYKGIQGYTRVYKGVQGYTRVYKGVQECTRVYKVIQAYTRVYNGIQRYIRLYRVIQGYTRVYKGILGYTRVYQRIQGYTWVYRGIQWYTRVHNHIVGTLYVVLHKLLTLVSMEGTHMHKTKLELNKPGYTGMTILDNSKILMYCFYYDHLLPRYGENCDLIYTDTDSLILDIKTEDLYADIYEDARMYVTSNYDKDHKLYNPINKTALGKMKDECACVAIDEVVAIRS